MRVRRLAILLALLSTLSISCATQSEQATLSTPAEPTLGPAVPTAGPTAARLGDPTTWPTRTAPVRTMLPATDLPTRLPTASALPSSIPATAPPTAMTVPSNTPAPSSMPAIASTPAAQQLICPLGLGLRLETANLILAYRDQPALVMTGSFPLAARYFPELQGWTRVLGAPSLPALEQKAERAGLSGMAYEALAYGLETGPTTPDEEWQDVVGSTMSARAIADRYDKLLVMGPGFRLMMENADLVPQMGVYSGLWMFQTQSFQSLYPPGADYRRDVMQTIDLIRSKNPDLPVWAQITFPPDRPPDPEEWLAYRRSIVDLVDGVYIGVYTWQTGDVDHLVATIDAILAAVCGGEQAD